MVPGLTKFKEFFRDFTEQYVLIGGAACDIIIERYKENPPDLRSLKIRGVTTEQIVEILEKLY